MKTRCIRFLLVTIGKSFLVLCLSILGFLSLLEPILWAQEKHTTVIERTALSTLARSDDEVLYRLVGQVVESVQFKTTGSVFWGPQEFIAVLGEKRQYIGIFIGENEVRSPRTDEFAVKITVSKNQSFEQPADLPQYEYVDELLGILIPLKIKNDFGIYKAGEIIYVSVPAVGRGATIILRKK